MPRHPFLFLPGPMNHVYCRVARDEFVFDDEAEEIPHLVGGVELAVSEDAVELLPNGVVRQTAARFEKEKVPGTVFRCCLMVAGLQLRSSSYAVTRRSGRYQNFLKPGLPGPASPSATP